MKRVLRPLLQRLASQLEVEIIPKWRLDRFPLARHLRRLFSRYEIRSVLDVGANRGQFHDFLREEVGFKGPIISFEPIQRVFLELTEKARHDPLWKPINVALGSEEGQKSFNVMAATEFASFLQPNPKSARYKDNVITATENVTVRRLDNVVLELQSQGSLENPYLKVDTQGYDLEVVAGAGSFLDSVRALQTEMSIVPIYEGMPSFMDAISLLGQKGFEISGMFPVAEGWQMRLIEFDCVMLNRSYFR
jgi:FkbM family methyltransferase